MKKYLALYNEVCQRNRNIMTIVNKDITQKCCIESLAPDFFGEPVLVLRPNNGSDDSLICLFVRNNYVQKERFSETKSHRGYLFGQIYFEYVTLRTH